MSEHFTPKYWLVYSDAHAPLLAFPFSEKISINSILHLEEQIKSSNVGDENLSSLKREIMNSDEFAKIQEENHYQMGAL